MPRPMMRGCEDASVECADVSTHRRQLASAEAEPAQWEQCAHTDPHARRPPVWSFPHGQPGSSEAAQSTSKSSGHALASLPTPSHSQLDILLLPPSHSSFAKMVKATVIGAAGGIGQPLSLLLKQSTLVTDLALYDV